MPREGVPYPERLLCSVRCELKNIWTALSGKLHSVNGVEGDGAGNVNIVSGDAAVVVTTDPSLNQIEVSLDQSQLPAAAVTSVNGATGAVVLGGADIKTAVYGPSNNAIQDIGTARTAIQTANQNINAEATARANADNALQTNINTVNASVTNKVDKLTTAGPHVYTHYGSTQGELNYSSAIDYNSVAVRDNAGRFKVEDPVPGDTSKNVVTANWVSQTGNSAPNNLLHRSGVETKTGTLKLASYESLIYDVPTGGAPALNGNTTATQRILDQYINTGRDGNVWMIRNTVYQGANTKGYSRLLYLRRYDDNNNIMQVSFTFSIDANGKAHIMANDNDGTQHVIL